MFGLDTEGIFHSLNFSLKRAVFPRSAALCRHFKKNRNFGFIETYQNENTGINKKNAPFTVRSCIWWKVVDSNHRSHRRQIYSLFPLATRETFRIKLAEKVELVDGLEPPTC